MRSYRQKELQKALKTAMGVVNPLRQNKGMIQAAVQLLSKHDIVMKV